VRPESSLGGLQGPRDHRPVCNQRHVATGAKLNAATDGKSVQLIVNDWHRHTTDAEKDRSVRLGHDAQRLVGLHRIGRHNDGQIGDRAAISAIVREWNTGYSTVVVYWYESACDNALRAITGEQTLVGKNEWMKWWEKNKGSAK